MKNDSIIKEKTLRLVDYLASLSRLNSRVIRSFDEYNKKLWIWEIPREKNCYTRAWGLPDEHSDDVWIEIKKFPEPPLPKIPDKCRDWVEHESLRNTKDIPLLKDSILVPQEEVEEETGEIITTQTKRVLFDFPDIKTGWEEYLDKYWIPWSELYGRYAAVQKIYADFFYIYQEQQKLGEQYELVLCFGLLTWKSSLGHVTKRHLISAKASLVFEPHRGTFTIGPSTDGDQVDVEFDMLDVDDIPQNSRQLIDEGRMVLRDNIWDRANVDALLSAIANSLADSGQGEYYADHLKPLASVSVKPVVEFAPALILRKRSMKGLEQILAKMRTQIGAGGIITSEFLDLAEGLIEKGENFEKEAGINKDLGDTEIYFPLQANEEQRRIIQALNKQRGVLVQGPPGTGKSHTIANLICHLLATGQRVLVTAKTPRALQVLHDKLPHEIKPLCINLLGSGPEERESLEKSVAGILLKHDRRNTSEADGLILRLEQQIKNNREAKASADANIIALREMETFAHSLADGAYVGTAGAIARKLKLEDEIFSWFEDKIAPESVLSLSKEEISCLCRDIVQIDTETERQLSLFLPDPNLDLPTVEILNSLFSRENKAKQKIASNTNIAQSSEMRVLIKTEREFVARLAQSIGEISAAIEMVQKRPMEWIRRAIYDVLTDKDTPWRELLKLSTSHLKMLSDLAANVDAYSVTIPSDIDKKKLLHDARSLKGHFDAGGGTGFGPFKPKVLRDHGHFLGKVRVDGVECANNDALKKLIDYLTVEQKLDYIWSLWAGRVTRVNGPFPLQVAEISELQESLEKVILLYNLRDNALSCVKSIVGLVSPNWEDLEALHKFQEICWTVLAQFDLLTIEKEIDFNYGKLMAVKSQSDAHPMIGYFIQAFTNRDIEKYAKLITQIETMRAKSLLVRKKREVIGKIAETAPLLAGHLARCDEPLKWAEWLKNLDKAWAWARTKQWLRDFLSSDADSLAKHSARLSEDIRKDLAELASIKSWKFCFARMQDSHTRHLMSWQQSMKRLGKGTGKHAHVHRTNAQRHLNECREAVPAWIMPLHRVYETVDAGPGIFDVIIVDEASQCGPEGLPLLYLGARVLVVGDDKQISPEAVGTDRAQVQTLIRNHLYDYNHADSFDVESSLFDHGRIRFSNRITLREHFRCMPEIINFSNSLCYWTDPLIPLRQYPPDRLEPLKMVYVQKGYREGSGPRVINRPEAEALVNEIVRCCQDETYQGMTMGVIVLQGDAQAYLIEELLLGRLGAEEIEKRHLLCGNPYSFQGDERDIIFLSMVAAPNERIGVLTQMSDQRRFNVAASRARDQMLLFCSVTSNHLGEQCFRRRLLDYFKNPVTTISIPIGEDRLREIAMRANRMIEKPPKPFDSWFEIDVALNIASRGYRVVPQFESADKRIDLVVQGHKAQLAVECDGDFWHGVDEYAADMERQRKLERCGWRFVRIRESHYYAEPIGALDPLWAALDRMNIKPFGANLSDSVDQEDDNEEDITQESIDAEDDDNNVDDNDDNDAEEKLEDDDMENEPRHSSVQHNGFPRSIQEAMRVKPAFLSKTIIEILKERPNATCMRDKMATYILQRWGIRTRSLPRQQFALKVGDMIAVMSRKGYLSIYKSKNWRIKMGWEDFPNS